VPPHIVAPSVKATPPPPPPPPPPTKASTTGGNPDLEVVDNNSMVILRYKVKSSTGEEMKTTKLKKTDFGQIVELVKSGSKLTAVNSLKEKTGLSLKSSKDIIDSIKIK
jgi:ribosomal protein L7/L12